MNEKYILLFLLICKYLRNGKPVLAPFDCNISGHIIMCVYLADTFGFIENFIK